MTERNTTRELEKFLKKFFKGLMGATLLAYFIQILKKMLTSDAICEFADDVVQCESAQDIYDLMKLSDDRLMRDCAVILWDLLNFTKVAADKLGL